MEWQHGMNSEVGWKSECRTLCFFPLKFCTFALIGPRASLCPCEANFWEPWTLNEWAFRDNLSMSDLEDIVMYIHIYIYIYIIYIMCIHCICVYIYIHRYMQSIYILCIYISSCEHGWIVFFLPLTFTRVASASSFRRHVFLHVFGDLRGAAQTLSEASESESWRNLFVKIWWKLWLPSGKLSHSYGKIHHFSWENSLFLWPFSIVMLVYQRVKHVKTI